MLFSLLWHTPLSHAATCAGSELRTPYIFDNTPDANANYTIDFDLFQLLALRSRMGCGDLQHVWLL